MVKQCIYLEKYEICILDPFIKFQAPIYLHK